MAKQTAPKTPEPSPPDGEPSTGVEKAAEAVRRAEADLHQARELYEKLREQAVDRLRDVREKRVGDLIDGTLETVRKHPGPGLLVAGLVGFLLGKTFGRFFRR